MTIQTFLPYPDFKQSVSCLDPDRLGNQIYREGLTLIRGGWSHHPASKMWKGYEHALALYCLEGLHELKRRGRIYTLHYARFRALERYYPDTGLPWWLDDERIHLSHQAALLYKNYNWYIKYNWNTKPAIPNHKGSLPYYWPIQ